jgi:hypothetical protein
MAPANVTPSIVNCPVVTRYPEKGMIISLGRGMQALSMAIVIKIPV